MLGQRSIVRTTSDPNEIPKITKEVEKLYPVNAYGTYLSSKNEEYNQETGKTIITLIYLRNATCD